MKTKKKNFFFAYIKYESLWVEFQKFQESHWIGKNILSILTTEHGV